MDYSLRIKTNKSLDPINSEDNPFLPSYLPVEAKKKGIHLFDCFSFSLTKSKERFFGCSLPHTNQNQNRDFIELPESTKSLFDEEETCIISPSKNEDITRQALSFNVGTFPVILSSPHSGTFQPSIIPDRFWGLKIEEGYVNEILQTICSLLPSPPSFIFGNISRFKIDFNRPFLSHEGYNEKSGLAARIHAKYHFILRYLANNIPPKEYGVFLDLHGFDSKKNNHEARKADLILGTAYDLTLIERDGSPWGKKELINQLSDAGFSIFPTTPDEPEYGPLSGGIIIQSFVDYLNMSSIQIEISDKVRKNKNRRKKLAHTIAESLKFIIRESQDEEDGLNEASSMYS
ncbi:MAG: hypothetical protein ACFFC7_11620 [Candidatus Hermodarchaeota archaeon]